MPAFASRCPKIILPLALAALLALPACGADPTPTPVPTPTAKRRRSHSHASPHTNRCRDVRFHTNPCANRQAGSPVAGRSHDGSRSRHADASSG